MIDRIAAVSFALAMLRVSSLDRADANPLLGTWRLKSLVREAAGTSERYDQLGERPDGDASDSADGRMLVPFVASDRPRPRGEPTDDERIRLRKSMPAYGGTNTVSPRGVRD